MSIQGTLRTLSDPGPGDILFLAASIYPPHIVMRVAELHAAATVHDEESGVVLTLHDPSQARIDAMLKEMLRESVECFLRGDPK